MTEIVIMSLSIAPLGWSETVVWHHGCGAGRDDQERETAAQAFGAWPAAHARGSAKPRYGRDKAAADTTQPHQPA